MCEKCVETKICEKCKETKCVKSVWKQKMYKKCLTRLQLQYFSINHYGEISTKQSMSQVLQKQRLAFFEIRVSVL